ncbi:type II secretion system protein GspE [Candidatus Dependentiae bacterium]|nr:type II secretion system protein GspE [Candidatus Dependentiae bacterium]
MSDDKNTNNNSIYNLLSKEERYKKGINQDSIVDLVDSFLFKAIKYAASDIHLEQTQNDMRIRYRIDGILYDQKSISKDQGLAVISRIKILSSLDIAEKRIPQDGKFLVKVNNSSKNHLIDVRVSTFPSINGEKIVLRILDKEQNCIELNKLGMSNKTLQDIYSIIDRPQGFFLVTGPTGSGKTTTLYSILSYLNNTEKNIITMEDPVEYNIEGITQSQINEKAGFTFAKGLRSILRQDPDIVMVGEIRDKLTAQTAIEAALTGHLVLSTLHTNDSIGAVSRLIEMGVEPFLINSSLSGVLAQRLVRKLCSECKQEDLITLQEKEHLKNKGFDTDKFNLEKIYRPYGCNKCFDLGYKSRTGIFELLKIDDELRDLIIKKSSAQKIKEYAIKNNLNFIINDGIEKIDQGIISFEELFKSINL